MTKFAPSWVILSSDDDDEDEAPAAGNAEGKPGSGTQAEFCIEEDEDVQVLNVIRAENLISTNAVASSGHQTGNNVNFGREVQSFAVHEASLPQHSQPMTRKRRKLERHLLRKSLKKAEKFQSSGRSNIDGESRGTPTPPLSREIGMLAPASELGNPGMFMEGPNWDEKWEGGRRLAPEAFGSDRSLTFRAHSNADRPGLDMYNAVGGTRPLEHGNPAHFSRSRAWNRHSGEHSPSVRNMIIPPAMPSSFLGELAFLERGCAPGPFARERVLMAHPQNIDQHIYQERRNSSEFRGNAEFPEKASAPGLFAREWILMSQSHDVNQHIHQERRNIGDVGRLREWVHPIIDLASASPILEWKGTGYAMDGPRSNLQENLCTEFSELHRNIVSFCETYELTPKHARARQDAFDHIRNVVHEIWPATEVLLFGSTATGLALPWSDIDITVISTHQHCGQKPTTMSWLSALGRHLSRQGLCKSVKKIPHAKVPLLKIELISGLSCDISFDAHNGPRGVPVIREFMRQYEALRPLCLVLKFFLGQQNLNELYTGGLGSFCLINIVVGHLQKLGVSGGGHDLGALLLSFFDRYSSLHNYKTEVVSTRTGLCTSKQAKGWVNTANPDLLSVEDPLDPTSDIAKGSYKINDIRSKFSAAHSALAANWDQHNVLLQILNITGDRTLRPKAQILMSGVKRKRNFFADEGDVHLAQMDSSGRGFSEPKKPKRPKIPKKRKNYRKKKKLKKERKAAAGLTDASLSPGVKLGKVAKKRRR